MEELARINPAWVASMREGGVETLVLIPLQRKQKVIGYQYVVNYDVERVVEVKELVELTAYFLGAEIANYLLLERLDVMSHVDSLTGLNNHNAMLLTMKKYMEEETENPFGVVNIDLNGLKIVNDDEGHDAGDRLLVRAAALLKLAFGDYEIYRAGGDEFVLLCPGITEEQMQAQVQQLRSLADSTPDLSFAVGSVHAAGEYDIRKLMHTADELMYKDKQEYYRQHPEKDRRKQNRSD
jgi:diguanylate cyclase (GGDEF)-like protein